jgi:hypothetical protein
MKEDEMGEECDAHGINAYKILVSKPEGHLGGTTLDLKEIGRY